MREKLPGRSSWVLTLRIAAGGTAWRGWVGLAVSYMVICAVAGRNVLAPGLKGPFIWGGERAPQALDL